MMRLQTPAAMFTVSRLFTVNRPPFPHRRFPPSCLLAGLLIGCGAQTVSNQPASPSQETNAPEESDDERKLNEGSKDTAEFDAEAPREEPASEPSDFDGGPPSQKKKERFSLMESLQVEALGLDESFRPGELSCSGAVPHRDAICSIAERICNLDSPSALEGAKDCEKAKKSCSDAKTRYDKKCT